eukprot:118588_1
MKITLLVGLVTAIICLIIYTQLQTSSNDSNTVVDKVPVHHTCVGAQQGWKCDFQSNWSHRNGNYSFCDFDIISLETTSIKQFITKYYMKQPVLINSTINDFTNPHLWSKQMLIHFLGEIEFGSGESLKIIQQGGIGENKIKLKEFLKNIDENKNNYYNNNNQQYIFDRSIWNKDYNSKATIFVQNILPLNIKYFNYSSQTLQYDDKILAIGNTGTGATIHPHGTAWFYNIYGKKRWFLYPPQLSPPGGYPPSYSNLYWYNTIYPRLKLKYDNNRKYELMSNVENNLLSSNNFTILQRLLLEQIKYFKTKDNILNIINNRMLFKPLECIQRDGQILYIPEYFWHGVINIGDSIGVSIQSTSKKTLWEMSDPLFDVKNVTKHIIYNDKMRWSNLEIHAQKFESYKNRLLLHKYGPLNAANELDKAVSLLKIGGDHFDIYVNKAKIHCIKALLMDPTFAYGYDFLAEIYANENNIMFSETLLRIAYLLNPNDYYIRDALINVFKRCDKHHLIPFVNKREVLPE